MAMGRVVRRSPRASRPDQIGHPTPHLKPGIEDGIPACAPTTPGHPPRGLIRQRHRGRNPAKLPRPASQQRQHCPAASSTKTVRSFSRTQSSKSDLPAEGVEVPLLRFREKQPPRYGGILQNETTRVHRIANGDISHYSTNLNAFAVPYAALRLPPALDLMAIPVQGHILFVSLLTIAEPTPVNWLPKNYRSTASADNMSHVLLKLMHFRKLHQFALLVRLILVESMRFLLVFRKLPYTWQRPERAQDK
jgi:hypothetical protein